jgi:hypothetical protein
MPSLLHEGILELIRERPEFVADLLRELLHVDVPAFTQARLTDTTLSQPLPAEYRADAVVLFVDDRPVFGCIIEAQLAEDAKKPFSWPVYTMSARARHLCPFVLVVVTPSESVAAWASRPIALGGAQTWTPLVLGPNGIPVITDEIAAIAEPELALLSAFAHARHDTPDALAVALAALAGVASIAAEQQVLYFHLLRAAVGDAARKAFEMLPHYRLEKYLTEEERQRMRDAYAKGVDEGLVKGVDKGRVEGRVEGIAWAVVQLLQTRGFEVSGELRDKIATSSSEQLSQLFGRAAVVTRAEDLFG